MMVTNFFLLRDPHNGCMLLMLSEPPLVKGTTWSIPTTGVPSSSPLAKIVGFGLPDSFRTILSPLFTASYHFVAVAFVVLTSRDAHTIFVFCCPPFLVLGYLFLVLFLILSACLYPMGQIRSGFLISGVLL